MTTDTVHAAVDLDGLLEFVRHARGFDFRGYKRSSLARRVGRRMDLVGAAGYGDYQDFLEVHPDEFAELFDTVLINVTSFFRDVPVWDHLREHVLPAIVARRAPDAPIRVWCAGCASGEEPYTVAMVLSALLGDEAYRSRVKIYATDVDEPALQAARAATYSAKQVQVIPPEALDRCFDRSEAGYALRQDLRRTVVFGRNDLREDAPISRVDLLLCRNTLMYFNAEMQSQVLRRFHFALDAAGVLVLGKSETLTAHADLFVPSDLKRRVFVKAGMAAADPVRLHGGPWAEASAPSGPAALRDSAFEAAPVAQLIVDGSGTIVSVNQAARLMFSLDAGTVGRRLQDLELSYRPVELRSQLDGLRVDGRPVRLPAVRWKVAQGDTRIVDVQLTPLGGGAHVDGVSVSYADVTRAQSLQDELEHCQHDLGQAYDQLQSTVEELETTNEELRSANEQLETTNEELQSTNEELETTNEELQSANEELETMNVELGSRSGQLDQANAFLEAMLAAMGVAVAVLDGGQIVRVWNGCAEELWGIRSADAVGRHLLSLDVGLPVEELRSSVRCALADEHSERTVEAIDGRGRAVTCRVSALSPAIGQGDVRGLVVLMERIAAR
jgi:two-component system CheB/CheR fusion protein